MIAGFLTAFGSACAQNVIINGDFETGPFETNGVVTDWVVSGNVGDVSGQGDTSPTHAAAFSLGHDSQGDSISQTFATQSGQEYDVDFDAGVYGVRSGDPLQLRMQVFDAGMGTLQDQTVTPPDVGSFNPAFFAHYTFTFTADSTSTTLTFTDVGTGNASADVMLDTVSVATAPEPSAWILMFLGMFVVYGIKKFQPTSR
jgi:hypothetical protein